MALEKNVLLSSPWVVYQFLGSRVTFYFFDVCYLTLSGPIGVVSISWMQVGAYGLAVFVGLVSDRGGVG